MARFMSMAIIGVVLAAMLHYSAAHKHVVGGDIGWRMPRDAHRDRYISWAKDKQFVVGDTLVFNFFTQYDDVVDVSKESFDACDSSNPIGRVFKTGPANIDLDTAGDHYYISTNSRRCASGQKLEISVSSTATPLPPTTTNRPAKPHIKAPTPKQSKKAPTPRRGFP